MRLRAGVASNVGMVRQTNEDSYLVRHGLYVVCDGMGGARAGEVASEMACRKMLDLDPVDADPGQLLEAVKGANAAVAARSFEEEHLLGMGTTLTGAHVRDGAATIVHVGDSRAYLLHEGVLSQVTDDHSWVGEMVRRGDLTPSEAAVHPHRSVITRALGTDLDVEPDLVQVPLTVGDRMLICSDGLSGMVSDADMAETLGRDEDPKEIAALLVKAALAGGGDDNVTVIVIEVLPADADGGEGVEAEPLLGPEERGGRGPQRPRGISPRAGQAGEAVRERLRKKMGPARRPPDESESPDPAPEAEAATERAEAPDAPDAPDTPKTSDGAAGPSKKGLRGLWTRRKWTIVVLVVIVVLAIAVGGFALVNQSVYYVGTFDGDVALYQGFPVSILGLELSRVVEIGTVPYDPLPQYVKTRVDARDLVGKEEGRDFLRSLSAVQ